MDTRTEIPAGGDFEQLHDLLGAIIDLESSPVSDADTQTEDSHEQEAGISPGQEGENQSEGSFEWKASTPPPEQVDELSRSPQEIAEFRQEWADHRQAKSKEQTKMSPGLARRIEKYRKRDERMVIKDVENIELFADDPRTDDEALDEDFPMPTDKELAAAAMAEIVEEEIRRQEMLQAKASAKTKNINPNSLLGRLATLLEPVDNMMAWSVDASCEGANADLFFPERGASTRKAKGICRQCVAIDDCLDFAITTGEKFGIWGGKSERERRRVRKERQVAATKKTASA